MKLYLSGRWIGKRGFYRATIKDIRFIESIRELSHIDYPSFLLLSYHLGKESLNLPLKTPQYPLGVLIAIKGYERVFPSLTPSELHPTGSSMRDEDFISKVLEVKNLIEQGTIYQLNLSRAFYFELKGEPESLFFEFYKRQPVDYAFFLDLGEFFVICGSMELFLERKGEVLISKPIKGSAKKGTLLKKSQKDMAENLMITDVVRNDFGMIGKDIRVRELFVVKRYKTIYQMYSTVECKTSAELSDILFATFPPASVSGAPKRKAVEIIDKLEPHNREFYCGSGGILRSPNDFTLSVLIRTAIGKDKEITYYSGCGIVWDSDPEKELEELYLKIKAFY